MNNQTRPPIPADLKRQVRQECHFGCVICGMPLFDYDHIEDYADVQEHELDNLVLLCPLHHRAKTNGQLSRDRVREARASPFNAGRSESTPYGIEAAKDVTVSIGSNIARGPAQADNHDVIWINGESFLAIHHEGGSYTYSACVTDENGAILIHIDHGALVVATEVWDYRYEGRTVSIRRGQGDIVFEADISDQEFAVRRGAFVDRYEAGLIVQPNGSTVFTMSGLEIGGIRGGSFDSNAAGAIAIWRQSCFNDGPPRGFGFVRGWPPECEQMAVDLQTKQKNGTPGKYPQGLEDFRPCPRDN